LPFALIGVAAGITLFQQLDASSLKRALGFFVVLYGLYSLWSPEIKPESRWWRHRQLRVAA
jgi:uncharacterized membrane protein YfcA